MSESKAGIFEWIKPLMVHMLNETHFIHQKPLNFPQVSKAQRPTLKTTKPQHEKRFKQNELAKHR